MALSISGLSLFISDIRACANEEEELEVVELQKQEIRKILSSKDDIKSSVKKACIWKLVYIKLLGHDVTFCIEKAPELIASENLSEKYTGYIATSLLIGEKHVGIYEEITPLVSNDLYSSNQFHQSMALSLVGNVANTTLAGALVQDITKIALGQSDKISIYIRQKSIMALLRIFRKFKDNFPDTDPWVVHVKPMLEQKDKLSFINATLSLTLGIVNLRRSEAWSQTLPEVIEILNNLIIHNRCPQNYKYYGINCPWIIVKCLRIVARLPVPKAQKSLIENLEQILNLIFASSQISSNPRTNNTTYSIVFEAIKVIVHYKSVLSYDLQNQVLSLIVAYMTVPQPNIRYLALDSMTQILILPGADEAVSEQLKTILQSLQDKDTSIRRRSLDLLYLMCNYNNVGKIVEELLNYIEETDMLLKEEFVLKIAVLCEKFAPNLTWYLDVIIRLMTNSGDYITEDIWHRVVQIITGFGEDTSTRLRKYACTLLFNSLSMPHIHEVLVKVGSYVLAEFGGLIKDLIGDINKLFYVIHKHFDQISNNGKAMVLNAYAKLARKVPSIKEQVLMVYESLFNHWDPDLQTRALEYHVLLSTEEAGDLSQAAFNQMPTFPQSIQDSNPLLTKMVELKTGAKQKEGEDPTLDNEAKKLIDTQMDIIKARSEQIAATNPTSGVKYHDMFIEKEAVHVKFIDSPLFEVCKNRLALAGDNIMLTPDNIQFPAKGIKELKSTFLGTGGVIYEDEDLKINYKGEKEGLIMKVGLQFVTKTGLLNIHRATIQRSEGLKMMLSPIKVLDHPQLMINLKVVGAVSHIPVIKISYNQNAQERSLDFGLPIFIHKFLKPHNISYDNFERFYQDFSTTNNPNIFKLDEFIKNPAGPNVPIGDALKKIAGLLSGGFNLNAVPHPSSDVIKKIWASGQYTQQADNETEPTLLPLLVEIEAYQEDLSKFRFSIRCGGSPYIAFALYQIMIFYLSGQYSPLLKQQINLN